MKNCINIWNLLYSTNCSLDKLHCSNLTMIAFKTLFLFAVLQTETSSWKIYSAPLCFGVRGQQEHTADRNHTLAALAAAEGRKRFSGKEQARRCISCISISDFMKILIALTSRSTVNNKILISAYWIAFFSYIGVSMKFIVINVSQKFIAWEEKIKGQTHEV